MDIRRKVIIVTGSSRGIGAATALEAARQEYSVCINYLNDEKSAYQVADQISKIGVPYIVVQADVSQEEQVKMMFERTDAELGPISALVNNVGILEEKMPLSNMNMARIERILKTNILSVFACCREAIKYMTSTMDNLGGSIVNVSSVASRLGSAGEYVDYAASKGAIDTLTIGLSKEVASENIRVNCVRPGFIETNIHKDGGEENRVQRLSSQLPLKRGGKPQEVTNAILWLLSDEASYVTGSFIDLAGGV